MEPEKIIGILLVWVLIGLYKVYKKIEKLNDNLQIFYGEWQEKQGDDLYNPNDYV